MLGQAVLDLGGIDVKAAADDHVLGTVHQIQIAIAVHARHIAGMQPVALENLGVFLGAVQITVHHQRAAHAQLTHLARRNFA
ncbi:hypothetical protein D9M70_640020 [compost metagenome]